MLILLRVVSRGHGNCGGVTSRVVAAAALATPTTTTTPTYSSSSSIASTLRPCAKCGVCYSSTSSSSTTTTTNAMTSNGPGRGLRPLTTHPAADPEHAPAPAPQLTVKQVYKNLLHLGKDFPKGYEYFRDRCKLAFMKNSEVTDPDQMEVLLARAVYVTKELEALYMLKKYRTLKKRYYADELK